MALTSGLHCLLVCLWVADSGVRSEGNTFPSLEKMEQWVTKLDSELERITNGENDITRATQFAQAYQKAFDEGVGYSIEKPDGEKIVRNMADKISQIFERNIQALESLQESTEQAVKDYIYDDNLSLDKVDYVNVNEMDDWINQTEYSDHFKQEVYRNASGVQIPIEIYEGYNSMQMTKVCPECTSVCDLCENSLFWRRDADLGITDAPLVKDPNILNTIAWSQALDATFKANSERYPGIYWQSFGSQEGVLRVYPASKWKTVDDLPDLFDVRRRPWYIHGTSSPKDVIILLDTSGSMHGQSFDIMKIAAKTLLNTLGENDYVNVAAFSRNITWVTPCLGDGLVQANARNKRLLFDGIDLLVDRNIASFRKALDFAYTHLEEFEDSRDEHDGSDCHKLIMIFSDGGTEDPTKILKVYTNSSRGMTANARIFTYAVGPHPLPTVALKDMACATGGAFTTITAMGAIRTKVQSSYVPIITHPVVLSGNRPLGFSSIYPNAVDYIRILNRPLVLSKFYDFSKTTFFSRDHLGLGFVTTITMPVFNTSSASDNQTLAGVVGIDIPVSRFESFAPKSHLGPLGYTFGINTNGFLIFHPSLWMVTNYLEDPAHNDLEDLEGDTDEVVQLRKEMINMASDGVTDDVRKSDMVSSVILNPGHSASLQTEYFFSAIKKTRFSLSVVVPDFWRYISVPEQSEVKETLDQMSRESQLLLAERKFCDETKEDEDGENDSLTDLLEKLDAGNCRGRDLNHVLWDYKVTLDAWKSWAKAFVSRFVLTDGGIIRIDERSRQRKLLERDPYNSSLYKMALLSPSPVVYVEKHASRQVIPIYIHSASDEDEDDGATVSDDEDDEEDFSTTTTTTTTTTPPKLVMQVRPPSIYIAKAINVVESDEQSTVGVSGVELKAPFLRELIYNVTDSSQGMDCRKWPSELTCFLIDTSGYVLATNQEKISVGDFLGVADPQMMGHFLDRGFFQSRIEYNYQALCPTEIDCKTDSVGPLPRLFLSTLFESAFGLLSQLSYGLWSLMFLLNPAEGVSEYTRQVTEGLHRCTTKTEHWEWKNDPSASTHHDQMICQGVQCGREVHSFRLQNLNAIFVVAHPPEWCPLCKSPLIFDGPLEVPTSEECLLPTRYRRRPQGCYATHEAEVFECRSSGHQFRSMPLVVYPSLVFFYLWWPTSSAKTASL